MEIFKEIKLIWKYLARYKREARKLLALAMLASAVLALIPYIYGRLVDLSSVEASDFKFVIFLLGIWVLMSVSSAFLVKIVGSRGSSLGVDCFSDLISESSSHITALPLEFHNEKKTGELFSKIQRGGDYIFRIIDNIIFWFLPQFTSVVVGILIMFFVEWRLALGTTIVILGYILIAVYKTTPIVEKQEKLNKIFEEVYGNLYDSLSNTQVIKSCAAENFQKDKTEKDFREKLGVVFKDFIGAWYTFHLWQDVFYSFAFVIIFGSAIILLGQGSISPGKLVMFLGYLSLIQTPLRALGFQWKAFRSGITAIKRVEGLLEMKTEDYMKKGKVLEDPKGKIEFKNVSFGYNKKKTLVLKNINFLANPGEKIALVGGSGEGKTTLVDLISLYFKPKKGKILLDGIDIQELNLGFLRKIIAYVPQETSLFNDTVKNNIRYGKSDATNKEIVAAAKAANAHHFIESFSKKYDSLVGERGIKLSTGQKQRIAIARALIQDPRILILDEATSSLDSESEKLVQEALEKLIKGRTTFIVAHRLSTIRKANKILVLEKGKVVEKGTHRELIKKKGTYYKFYSLQFEVKK